MTRLVEECRGKEYEKRLDISGLTTIETRAIRGDMLKVYKIMHGLEGIKEEEFLKRDGRRGRGHSLKLFKKRVRLEVAIFSFGNSACTEWNKLSESIVSASSINVFKNRLDDHLRKIRGFK